MRKGRMYKGGWTQDYRVVRIDENNPFVSMARRGRGRPTILEHRYVMAQLLNRCLSDTEVVHHKDGNKLNNAIDNLELTDYSTHATKHLTGMKQRPETCEKKRLLMLGNTRGFQPGHENFNAKH
jgi:hypothetical protein